MHKPAVLGVALALLTSCTERWTGATHTCHVPSDEGMQFALELEPPGPEGRIGYWEQERDGGPPLTALSTKVDGAVDYRFHASFTLESSHDVALRRVQPGVLEGTVTFLPAATVCEVRLVRAWRTP